MDPRAADHLKRAAHHLGIAIQIERTLDGTEAAHTENGKRATSAPAPRLAYGGDKGGKPSPDGACELKA